MNCQPPTESASVGGGGNRLAHSSHAISWENLAAWVQKEATNRQAALQPIVERWDSGLISHAELERIGCENWARVFGVKCDTRTIRRLVGRIVERDGGRREWTRRDLYVRENPPRQPGSAIELPRDEESFADVLDVLNGIAAPGGPTPNESSALRLAAWRWYRDELAAGSKPKVAKARLVTFLLRRAAWLAPTRQALTVSLARWFAKLDHAQGTAAAAQDGRRARRGHKSKPEIPEADKIKIASYALQATGKRYAQAERELVRMGAATGISQPTLDLMDTGASKTYVNRRLAKAVQPLIRAAAPYFLGRQAVDDATPALIRDYSKLRSMQVVTADDFTMPVYFWIEDAQGHPITDVSGRPLLTRGQVLLFIDVRSLKIITWALIPQRNYNALQVRSAMNTVCLEQGRPDVWYFERALWKESHLVKGTVPKGWHDASISASDTAGAWEKLGVRFVHATRARAKPAELVGGKLQNLMERLPGYCGRNEREDCPEITKQAKLAVEGRRTHPSEHFYSFRQWVTELARLVEDYNADPQEGRILKGLSPDQAFQAFWPHDNPPVKFDPTCWHLCAHYVRECEVKPGGISFTFGRETFAYYDEALGKHAGHRVRIWFDPAHPEVLGVTDMDDRHPFFVQRANPVDFLATLDPESTAAEQYINELAKQAGHAGNARATYRSAKAEFERTFRQNIVARPTAKLGQELLEKRAAAVKQQKAESQVRRQILDLCRELEVAPETISDLESVEIRDTLRRRRARRREALTEDIPQHRSLTPTENTGGPQ